jgi:predicted nucleotidyltransferase
MCTQSEAIEIFNEVVKRCEELFGDKLRDAYLYGSYARGDFDDESDIDILVTVDKDAEELSHFRRNMSYINSDLGLEHDILISTKTVPYEQFRRYSEILPFYRNVLEEGIKYARL